MIAAWMLYCSLCAVGLAAAGLIAERLLLAAGGAVRHVWIGAVALSLLIPAAAFRFAPRPSAVVSSAPAAGVDFADSVMVPATHVPSSAVETANPRRPRWNWPAMMTSLSSANRPLALAWMVLSLGLAAYFVVGIVALARLRRRWQRRDVLGVPVFVSQRTGPAVIGAVTPAIVLPEWALAIAPAQLALMLRHEEEHRRAGDVQLLTAAHLALIVMPWNAGLWWLVVRLGMAVELDCDARVLRDADARSYGDLLLEVARPRRSLPLIGATAFAERAGQLERRIRALVRRRRRTSRVARTAVAFIGLATVTIAWAAPRPPAPARSVGDVRTDSAANTAPATPASKTPPQLVQPVPQPAPSAPPRATPAVANDSTLIAAAPAPVQQEPPRPASPMVDSVMNRLFAGITLTFEQAAAARQLIAGIEVRQVIEITQTVTATLASLPARQVIVARRDSALRALLATDADRAAFDARVAATAGRGRSGNPGLDTFSDGGGRRGRGGNGGGGGGGAITVIGSGRGGARGRSASLTPGSDVPQNPVFDRLLGGLSMTPDQDASARDIIAAAQQDLFPLTVEPPLSQLALTDNAGVIMRPEGKAAVSALLTNDADRALVESRIVVPTRTLVRPPPGTPHS